MCVVYFYCLNSHFLSNSTIQAFDHINDSNLNPDYSKPYYLNFFLIFNYYCYYYFNPKTRGRELAVVWWSTAHGNLTARMWAMDGAQNMAVGLSEAP